MKKNVTDIVMVGKVEDIDSPEDKRSWSDDATPYVKESLKAKGFTFEELEIFDNFLVSTESGDYTNVLGITGTIPYYWLNVYKFVIDGVEV